MTAPRNRKLTPERAREVLSYNKRTGKLRWRVARGKNQLAGKEAGSPRNGYIRVKVDGRLYQATTIIWLIVVGRYPLAEIDHRDTDNSNDRLINLREATRAQNNRNTKLRKDNTSGLKGVIKVGRKWGSQINADGVSHWLGTFETKEQAHEAYKVAATSVHGEFARIA